jgi:uncharacterized protein (DUF3820 family)
MGEASLQLSDAPEMSLISDELINQVMERTITYGKYKGSKTYFDILNEDPDYFIWITNKMIESKLEETKTFSVFSLMVRMRIPIDKTRDVLPYGKYKGKTYQWLLSNKTQYFTWLLDQKKKEKPFDNETRYMKYLMEKH